MAKCVTLTGAHKYEARYEDRSRQLPGDIELEGNVSLKTLRELTTLKVYVRDVCVWCGDTIERSPAP